MEQDWGESPDTGKNLATLQEVHSHKRDERKFQLQVILVFSGLVLLTVIMQACGVNMVAKDIILTFLPIFTFALGKTDSKHG